MSETKLHAPTHPYDAAFGVPETEDGYGSFGLTKREYFAVTILAGMNAADSYAVDSFLAQPLNGKIVVKAAVEQANELIAELNRGKVNE